MSGGRSCAYAEIVASGLACGNRREHAIYIANERLISNFAPERNPMNRKLCSRFVLVAAIASSSLALAACGSGVAGTYTNANGLVTLDLQGGGKASLTIMGQNDVCKYDVAGKSLTLICKEGNTSWGIHDDGSISGPGFIGTLQKSKK
jgi:hypothetical protein